MGGGGEKVPLPSIPSMSGVLRAGRGDAAVSIGPPRPRIPSGRLAEPSFPASCGGHSAYHWMVGWQREVPGVPSLFLMAPGRVS